MWQLALLLASCSAELSTQPAVPARPKVQLKSHVSKRSKPQAEGKTHKRLGLKASSSLLAGMSSVHPRWACWWRPSSRTGALEGFEGHRCQVAFPAATAPEGHPGDHADPALRERGLERGWLRCQDIAESLQKVVMGSVSRHHQTESGSPKAYEDVVWTRLGMAVDIAVTTKGSSRPIVFIEVDGAHSLMRTLDLAGASPAQLSRVRGPVLLKRYLLQKRLDSPTGGASESCEARLSDRCGLDAGPW